MLELGAKLDTFLSLLWELGVTGLYFLTPLRNTSLEEDSGPCVLSLVLDLRELQAINAERSCFKSHEQPWVDTAYSPFLLWNQDSQFGEDLALDFSGDG